MVLCIQKCETALSLAKTIQIKHLIHPVMGKLIVELARGGDRNTILQLLPKISAEDLHFKDNVSNIYS